MILRCENYLCIYQKDGECALDSVLINIQGHCEDCIYPDIDFDKLEEVKEKYREVF